MIIAALEKFTTLDYPGKLSALVYTYGCTMKCPFCHNPELVTGKLSKLNKYSEEEIIEFMKKRKGKLDALAITGGEPTLHTKLEDFIKKIKDLGFEVKLDTYGLNPKRVKEIAKQKIVDYWAMDVKGNLETYVQCGYKSKNNDANKKVDESIKIIMNSGVNYEFRTTVLKSTKWHNWHSEGLVEQIGQRIKGAKNYYLQNFRAVKTQDKRYQGRNDLSFSHTELNRMKEIMENYVEFVGVRE